MPISGITAIIEKEDLETVKKQIVSALGGEIVKAVDNHLVVVLETGTDVEMQNKFEELSEIQGVTSASMAYYSEEDVVE